MLDEEREKENDAESPCEVKTVTVSTLPVLRENEFSFTGGGSGSVAGGGGESRLLLFVRTDLPGRISVMDDLDNTALPYFTLGKNIIILLPLYCPPIHHRLYNGCS